MRVLQMLNPILTTYRALERASKTAVMIEFVLAGSQFCAMLPMRAKMTTGHTL